MDYVNEVINNKRMELLDESRPIARKDTVDSLSETMAVKRGLSKGMKNAVN